MQHATCRCNCPNLSYSSARKFQSAWSQSEMHFFFFFCWMSIQWVHWVAKYCGALPTGALRCSAVCGIVDATNSLFSSVVGVGHQRQSSKITSHGGEDSMRPRARLNWRWWLRLRLHGVDIFFLWPCSAVILQLTLTATGSAVGQLSLVSVSRSGRCQTLGRVKPAIPVGFTESSEGQWSLKCHIHLDILTPQLL